jgi:hypothetical protein
MRLSLSHPPERRRLFVAGSVRGIIGGIDLREPLHAGGMNFGDTVLEGSALHFVRDFGELRVAEAEIEANAHLIWGTCCPTFPDQFRWFGVATLLVVDASYGECRRW